MGLEIILPTEACPEHEAGHCWHGFGQALHCIENPAYREICCHCGRFGHYRWDHSDQSHGRHHPNPGRYVLVKVTEAYHERP